MADEFELSALQRTALLDFITRADATSGDGSFDPRAEYAGDAVLIATALRAGLLLGYDAAGLEALFRREFEISGITEGVLGSVMGLAMLADTEGRLRAAAGGKN